MHWAVICCSSSGWGEECRGCRGSQSVSGLQTLPTETPRPGIFQTWSWCWYTDAWVKQREIFWFVYVFNSISSWNALLTMFIVDPHYPHVTGLGWSDLPSLASTHLFLPWLDQITSSHWSGKSLELSCNSWHSLSCDSHNGRLETGAERAGAGAATHSSATDQQ